MYFLHPSFSDLTLVWSPESFHLRYLQLSWLYSSTQYFSGAIPSLSYGINRTFHGPFSSCHPYPWPWQLTQRVAFHRVKALIIVAWSALGSDQEPDDPPGEQH